MVNSVYYEIKLIIQDLTDDLEQNNTFDIEALDKLLENLEVIFDAVDVIVYVQNIKSGLQSYLAAGLNKEKLTRPSYTTRNDIINQNYRRFVVFKTRVSQLEKCLSQLKSKNTLALNGNLFNSFSIEVLSDLIHFPEMISNYLQSRELLQHIFLHMIYLYTILFENPTSKHRTTTLNALYSLCDLAEQAGYIDKEQNQACREIFKAVEIDTLETLEAELMKILNISPSEFEQASTNYFDEG